MSRCLINNLAVSFLFDTGTVKTIIAERVWKKCKTKDIKIEPMQSTIETCSGGPIQVVGTARCSLKIGQFNDFVEVIVVKKLVYDCLFGLDVAFKIDEVRDYLSSIKEVFDFKPNTNKSRNELIKKEVIFCK